MGTNITARLYANGNNTVVGEVEYRPNWIVDYIADDLRDNHKGWDYAIVIGTDGEEKGTIVNPKWDGGNIVAVLDEPEGHDRLLAYDVEKGAYVGDGGEELEDDYGAHVFAVIDYRSDLDFDVFDADEYVEYAGKQCGLVFSPTPTWGADVPEHYEIVGTR